MDGFPRAYLNRDPQLCILLTSSGQHVFGVLSERSVKKTPMTGWEYWPAGGRKSLQGDDHSGGHFTGHKTVTIVRWGTSPGYVWSSPLRSQYPPVATTGEITLIAEASGVTGSQWAVKF